PEALAFGVDKPTGQAHRHDADPSRISADIDNDAVAFAEIFYSFLEGRHQAGWIEKHVEGDVADVAVQLAGFDPDVLGGKQAELGPVASRRALGDFEIDGFVLGIQELDSNLAAVLSGEPPVDGPGEHHVAQGRILIDAANAFDGARHVL